MLLAAARAFASMGAVVSVSRTGENLVQRRALPRTHGASTGASLETTLEVQAQGLPNLLHELVHALLAGRLEDDHGFDYGGIPYDLTSTSGRAVLWDELAACALSCRYLRASLDHEEIDVEEIDRVVDAWFVEQVEIQPVFYGLEDDPPAFVARVGALLRADSGEADAFVARAQALLSRALAGAGAAPELSAPGACESLAQTWTRTMETSPASSPETSPTQMTEAEDRRRLPAAPG